MFPYLDNKKNAGIKIFQCFKVCRDYGPCVLFIDNIDEYLFKKGNQKRSNNTSNLRVDLKKSILKMIQLEKMAGLLIGLQHN